MALRVIVPIFTKYDTEIREIGDREWTTIEGPIAIISLESLSLTSEDDRLFRAELFALCRKYANRAGGACLPYTI